MSGIHKSKEVYKYTNTAQGKRLVPVRGLYVSGIPADHMVKMLSVDTGAVTVDYYTKGSATLKADHMVKMLNVDVGAVTYDEFLTREGAIGKQPGIEILEFSTTDPAIS